MIKSGSWFTPLPADHIHIGISCSACRGTEQAMRDHCFAVWRQQVGPTARMITVTGVEGHA